MLSVRFDTLTRYPTARSPSTGVLIGLDEANLTCIVTIDIANDLATTNTPAPRAIENPFHTAENVRVVRRGRDRHLHGHVLMLPECTLASVAATLC